MKIARIFDQMEQKAMHLLHNMAKHDENENIFQKKNSRSMRKVEWHTNKTSKQPKALQFYTRKEVNKKGK